MFREEATFWTSEELPGVELLRAVYLDQSFPPHAHDTFALGVIEEGSLAMRYRKSHFVAPRGSIGFALPGETDNHVGGEHRAVKQPAHFLNDFGVFGGGVMPVHCLQCFGTATLQRQVKLRA